MDTRIKLNGQRLAKRLAGSAQLQRVAARHNQRSLRLLTRSLPSDRVVCQCVFGVVQQLAVITIRKRERRRITKIPGEAIHTRSLRQTYRGCKPVIGSVRGKQVQRLRRTGELSNLASLVE